MADEFTSSEIRRLLDLLEAELAQRGVSAAMYVVGGAAIALTYSSGRRTKDVDATFAPERDVVEAARAVADSEGLPLNWLNADAAPWVPPRAAETVSAPTLPGLKIEIATPEALLAMKLVASRNRDISDIKLLAEAIGMTDPSELADLVRREYGEEQLEIHGGYDDMLLWCRSLVGMLWP